MFQLLTGDDKKVIDEDIAKVSEEVSELREDLDCIIDYSANNILNPNISWTDGKYMGIDGKVNENNNYSFTDYLMIKNGKRVCISSNIKDVYQAFIIFFDFEKNKIGDGILVGSNTNTYTFIVPDNAMYFIMSCKTEYKKNIKLQYNDEPTSFTKYGEYILSNVKNSSSIKIVVDANGRGDYKELAKAISSITDSSFDKRYTIYVLEGIYDVVDELGGLEYINSITDMTDSERGITLPPYVDLIGIGNVLVHASIPSSFNYNNNAISTLSALNLYYGNNVIQNIHFVALNSRYAVHIENGGNVINYNIHFSNCIFEHNGNDALISEHSDVWQSCYGVGCGVGSNANIVFDACVFKGTNRGGITVHDNNDFQYGAHVYFYGCRFYSNISTKCRVSTYGTGTRINEMWFIGCYITEMLICNEENKQVNRWKILGGGNFSTPIESESTVVPITHTFN